MLFPSVIDNAYRGQKAALWLLGFLAVVKAAMAINCILNGEAVLVSADGVPLGTYPPAAAQSMVALFAIWAVAHLIFALLALLALTRYRAMTPLVFALLLAEHLGRKLVLQFVPIVRSDEAPASVINLVLLVLIASGLLLSLWKRSGSCTTAPIS